MKVYLKRSGSDNNPAPPVYYHIQRTTASGEVLLVQGGGNEKEKEKYSPKRSLFSGGLPVGYRHRYSTFLFDQQLGCVYRLELGHSLSFDRKPRPVIRVKRTNIPYERFFRCSAKRFPAPKLTEEVERRWPANRCDQNYLKEEKGHGGNGNGGGGGGASSDKGGGGGGDDVVDDRTTTPSSLIDVAVDWKKVAAIYGGGLLLLVVVFGAFLCCCRRRSSAGSSCSASGKGQQQQQQSKHGRPKRIMHFLMEKISSRNSYAPSFSAASTSPFSTTSSTYSNASIISSEANSMVKKKKQQRPNTPIKKSPWAKKLGPGKKGRRWWVVQQEGSAYPINFQNEMPDFC